MDVNVVSIEITGTLTTFGQPEQDGARISSDLTGSAMSSTLRVWRRGRSSMASRGGLSYIQMGFVQIAECPSTVCCFTTPFQGECSRAA